MHMLCTICSDLVNSAESIYVTKCGHIFHHHCLAQWIERSKSCPQCRNKVTDKCMFRLFPTVSNDAAGGEDVATLQSRLDDAQLQLRQEKTVCKEKDDKIMEMQFELKKYEEIIKVHEKKLVSCGSAVKALKEQVEYLKIQNKETVNLKAENESLKQHLQLLNGLNDVLNATCEEVERMLEGYSDVRTVALFATALKRGLCESESKKREARDKLHEAKQQISADKNALADLRDKLIRTELKLNEMESKYQALVKRKSSEMLEIDGEPSSLEDSQPNPKQRRAMDTTFVNNTIVFTNTEDSVSPMVKRVLDADSPYLSLKQSNLALSALQRAPKHSIPVDKIKPSELAIINSARNAITKRPGAENMPWNSQRSLSIFNKKEPVSLDTEDEKKTLQPNICYDGLGGHSKLEIFPVPSNTPVKSYIPKLSAKHKLKRPLPSVGTQDIGKMLQKLMDK